MLLFDSSRRTHQGNLFHAHATNLSGEVQKYLIGVAESLNDTSTVSSSGSRQCRSD